VNQVLAYLRTTATMPVVRDTTTLRILGVLVFAVLTTFGAQVAVPLEFTPVPTTLQTLFVTLSGALLGPYLGAASQLAYLALGISGLPVFAMGGGAAYLLGPTGGYLLAMPPAAALTGYIARANARALRIAVAMTAGTALILLFGWAQLSFLTRDTARALELGVTPFLAGSAIKIAAATCITLLIRRPRN
jgi:biotin transport system substrate-specific component